MNDLANIIINMNFIHVLNGLNFKFWKYNVLIVLRIIDFDIVLRIDSPPPLTYESTYETKRKMKM